MKKIDTLLTIIILILLLLIIVFIYNGTSAPIDKPKKYNSNKKEITWFLENYVPFVNAGGETVAHMFNLYLIENGYTVNVVGNWNPQNYEGVNYIKKSDINAVNKAVEESSILCSQLGHAESTVKLAAKEDKNVIIFVHSIDHNRISINNYKSIIDQSKLLLVYNSESMKHHFDVYKNTFVLYPPVDCNKYNTNTNNKYVTIINVSKLKGGNQLIKIAKQMPNIQFLGVKGGYDKQIIDESVKNIKYVENTKDIKSIYAQTDILLIPSNPETWGRTATEAMCSGIPVIAHPTEGLKENLSYAGIFIDKESTEEWVAQIKLLKEDRNEYIKLSEKGKQRSKELNTKAMLEELLKKLELMN